MSVEGRERNRNVQPGAEYESLRAEIAKGLMSLEDEGTGKQVIERVYTREELSVAGHSKPMPPRGYDLKGGGEKSVLTEL